MKELLQHQINLTSSVIEQTRVTEPRSPLTTDALARSIDRRFLNTLIVSIA